LKHALVLLALLAASAGAEPLEIVQPAVPSTCVLPGTQMVGPCAFMAAMMQNVRVHCLGARDGGCGGGCNGATCPVKL
jgi:hypothetical protein